MTDTYELAMFPLGRAALPGETVPLRIFEPRYMEMIRDVSAGAGEFGIVLISRGSEVGGGDDRFELATATRILRDVPIGDEQRALVTLATRRVRIVEWLPEDPYPRAMVADEPTVPADAEVEIAPLRQKVRRLYALASELGADTGLTDFADFDGTSAGLWRLAATVPLGEMDRQRLIEVSDLEERARLLDRMVDEAIEELSLRLSTGG